MDIKLQSFDSYYRGFSIPVNASDYFDCEQCYYKIILTATKERTEANNETNKNDTNISHINIGIHETNKNRSLILGKLHRASLTQNQVDCFTFNTQMDDNTPLIVELLAFNNPMNVTFPSKESQIVKEEFMDKLVNKNVKNRDICIRPSKDIVVSESMASSYMLFVISEDDIEKYQRFNFLINGKKII